MNSRVIRLIAVIAILVVSLGAAISTASAQGGAYLRINNGSTISVARGERPQIVLQFGNTGRSTVQNAGILCVVTGDLTLTGAVQRGPFANFSIAPIAIGALIKPNQAISFPFVFSYLPNNPDTGKFFVNIPSGQNYNVAFNVRAVGAGGQVLCILVNGKTVNAVDPLSTPGAIYAAAAATINVR